MFGIEIDYSLPGDRISGEALTQRVQYKEDLKCQSDIIKLETKPKKRPADEPYRNLAVCLIEKFGHIKSKC